MSNSCFEDLLDLALILKAKKNSNILEVFPSIVENCGVGSVTARAEKKDGVI